MEYPVCSIQNDLSTVIYDLCDISIRLASLDVPTYNAVLKVFRVQSCLSQAQSLLSSLLIEFSNVPSSSVLDSRV